MVQVLDPPAPHVVAVRVDGPVSDAESDAQAVGEALDALPTTENAGLYVEMGWIWGDTRPQFVEGVRERLAALAGRRDLRRVAFVSSSYARRSVLRDESEPFDGLDVLVFPAAARRAALDWVAERTSPE